MYISPHKILTPERRSRGIGLVYQRPPLTHPLQSYYKSLIFGNYSYLLILSYSITNMAPNKYNDIVLDIVGQIGIIKAGQSNSVIPTIANKTPSSIDPNP
jgi:hypothetical protein